MERKTGVEPATFSLARRCSTTELLPLVVIDYASSSQILQAIMPSIHSESIEED